MGVKRSLFFNAVLIAVLLVTGSCLVKDPVTGKSTFNLMSESQEIELGANSHESVMDSFGYYENDTWQKYVDGIGQDIAKISHRPNLEFHFTVVDSPVVNAFALPGGWVYFTRGILAHFNSEDELAGVMGHEIGHVTARHSAEQYSRSQLAGIGLELGSAVSKNFRQYRSIAEIGTSLIFLKFSRNQESESDRLGVEYSSRLGFDSHQMAGFFRTIGRLSAESGQGAPNFLSTHPNPANREQRVHELTDAFRAEQGFQARKTDRNAYLRKLEGLVYGEDPRQGFHDEARGVFYHPNFDIQFPIPKGWQFQRNRTAFQMVHPDGKGGVVIQKVKEYKSNEAAAADFIEKFKPEVLERKSARLNGFQAVRIRSVLSSQEQELGVLSYFISNGRHLYISHGFSEKADFPGLLGAFQGVQGEFSRVTSRQAKGKRPLRIRIKAAPRNGSLVENLKALRMKDEDLKALAVLNGKEPDDAVRRGELLKTSGN